MRLRYMHTPHFWFTYSYYTGKEHSTQHSSRIRHTSGGTKTSCNMHARTPLNEEVRLKKFRTVHNQCMGP